MRFEVDLHDCEMTGALPPDLDGAFYRLHLDWLYPPLFEDDTILAADGYMSMFRLKGGKAHYKGRYVRTERYRKQIEAGRQVYGYYLDPNTLDTRAQTNFGGAWKSETFTAHPKIDPTTGETFGYGYEATGLCSRD